MTWFLVVVYIFNGAMLKYEIVKGFDTKEACISAVDDLRKQPHDKTIQRAYVCMPGDKSK